MENVANLYSYGDMPPWGKGPVQGKIRQDPNYIKDEFPLLDKFTECTVTITRPGDEASENKKQTMDDGVDVARDDAGQKFQRRAEGLGKFHPKELLKKGEELMQDAEYDMMHVGAAISGMMVLILIAVSLLGRKRKKAHKH